MQSEARLAEEEYRVRWLGERGVGERGIGVRLAGRGGAMNTGCDVWWNSAVVLSDKRWYCYQTARILIEVAGFGAGGIVCGGKGKGKVWIWEHAG